MCTDISIPYWKPFLKNPAYALANTHYRARYLVKVSTTSTAVLVLKYWSLATKYRPQEKLQ